MLINIKSYITNVYRVQLPPTVGIVVQQESWTSAGRRVQTNLSSCRGCDHHLPQHYIIYVSIPRVGTNAKSMASGEFLKEILLNYLCRTRERDLRVCEGFRLKGLCVGGGVIRTERPSTTFLCIWDFVSIVGRLSFGDFPQVICDGLIGFQIREHINMV